MSGVLENLEQALAFDARDVSGVIDGLNVLQESFASQMESARADREQGS